MRKFRTELMVYFITLIVILLTVIGGIFYSWTKRTTGRMISDSTVETLKQIDKNVHLILGYVKDISLFIISNHDVRTFLKLSKDDPAHLSRERLYENFSNLTTSEPFIASINIYGNNGLTLETGGSSIDLSNGLLAKYEQNIPQDGYYIITPTYKRHYQNLGDQYIISFYRRIRDINNLNRTLGTLRIDINERSINRLYQNIKLGDTGYFFIVDKDGYIVSHSQKDQIFWFIKEKPYFKRIFDGKEGYFRKKINGTDMFITYYTSVEENLIYVGVAPFKELIKDSKFIGRLSFLIILIASMIAIYISYLISSKVTTPIKQLTELMQEVERDNLDVVINIDRKDEIGTLARSFNQMVSRVKTLINEVYQSGLMRKEAELKALQAQINPHFLYNTLDTIYWTSRMENAPKTGELVKALSRLFRLGLNNGKEMTTIEKEVEHIQNYLLIQKNRYEHEPCVEIDIDPALYAYSTIKLILQPLLENALYHGFGERDGAGKIRITGRECSGDIIFEITDNGVGIDQERLNEILKDDQSGKKGFGLKNVDERIKLYFGEEYGIEIESEKGKGTKVRVRIAKRMEGDGVNGIVQNGNCG